MKSCFVFSPAGTAWKFFAAACFFALASLALAAAGILLSFGLVLGAHASAPPQAGQQVVYDAGGLEPAHDDYGWLGHEDDGFDVEAFQDALMGIFSDLVYYRGWYDFLGLGGFLEIYGTASLPSFTFDGTGDILDNFLNEIGIEFMSFTSADGHLFYMVIDRNRDAGNVYLLRTVMSEDLLPLAEDYAAAHQRDDLTNYEMLMVLYDLLGQGGAFEGDLADIIEEARAPEAEARGFPLSMIQVGLIVVLLAAVGIGFVWPWVKKRRSEDAVPQFDYDDGEELEPGDAGGSIVEFDDGSDGPDGGKS